MTSTEDYNRRYYAQAIGYTIVDVLHLHNPILGDTRSTLVCERRNDDGTVSVVHLEIGQRDDPEAPGFLYGLPRPQ